jgi:tripartite ATP-independent transporter DctP family solute receptor
MSTPFRTLSLSVALLFLVAACNGAAGSPSASPGGASATPAGPSATADASAPPAAEVELTLAHSYQTDHAHHRCGAVGLAENVAARNVGLTIEIFPASQLGPDADRFTSVSNGDIDIDLQGASAIAATFPDVGVVDAAYVFDDADHVFEFLETDTFTELQADALAATGVHLLDAWWFGMRQFTANKPIRHPDDFAGLRMRFPDTPRYLANAEALGAEAVAVAFEEVYLSLQQGVIDGQENPIPTISSLNLPEVQSHVSLTAHQAGFQFVIVSDATWQELSTEQQEALTEAIREVRAEDRQCIEDDEQRFIDEWSESGDIEVVEDVDRDAFIARAEEYFSERLEGRELELYEAIRALRQ